ncbi:alpha/beta hydrolase [Variovorax sp. ZS18.2.2]|uniref:alpha/beta fold hydrolase n=1 Tax=Variovorax sp. ZS18.2.2 TaxID=2971255 RepID=UPI002150EAC9|nr:alpha/beta hydrolase [Variovorax sp. ZS18.2.2]MCR6478480.1 alpha/beta hydrolase [Variovorax sp. ZS18.2.2]
MHLLLIKDKNAMSISKSWAFRTTAVTAGALLIAAVLGAAYERIAQQRAAENFPPPGKLVDIGGRRVQLHCIGAGSPTVVFEAGLTLEGATTWSLVHRPISAFARACTYSRAGLMWSDETHRRQSGRQVAQDLHATLKNAGESGPFILVGHSLGGPYSMTYTKYFGEEVAGLVLVDASHPDQVRKTKPIMTKPKPLLLRIGAPLAWTGLVRAVSPMLVPHDPDRGPRDVDAVRAYAPRSLAALMTESEELDAVLAEAGTFRDLGCRPLYVLTAMKPYPAEQLRAMKIDVQQGKQVQAIWRNLQEDMAGWSTWSEHQVLDQTGHGIQFEDPQAVVAAVRSVVESSRSNHCDPSFW